RPARPPAHRGVHGLVCAAGAAAAGLPARSPEGVHLPGGATLQAREVPGPGITGRRVAEADLLPGGAVRAQGTAQPHSLCQLVDGNVVEQTVQGVDGQLRWVDQRYTGRVLGYVGHSLDTI